MSKPNVHMVWIAFLLYKPIFVNRYDLFSHILQDSLTGMGTICQRAIDEINYSQETLFFPIGWKVNSLNSSGISLPCNISICAEM